MKVLITGSNGLLGQKLIDLIAPIKEHILIATARGKDRHPANSNQYVYESMDITDALEVENTLVKHQPDCVINTAAMTNVDQCEDDHEGCWKLNVTAVAHLIAACEKINAFFLHLSTDFIFDGQNGPYSETDKANPISYYGKSKLAAETLVKESNAKWSIARTVLVYGIAHDMSRSNIILWVKKSLEENTQIKVVNDQWRTPTLAEDLAKGCLLIVEQQAAGVFNISGNDLLTPYEMAIMTANYFALDKSLITEVDGSIFKQRAKRPPKTGFILDKAAKILGYKPIKFQDGIAHLANQLEEKP